MQKKMLKTVKLLVLSLIITIAALIHSMSAFAQISEGGIPPSFTFDGLSLRSTTGIHEAAIDFDVNRLLAEDDATEGMGVPPRCAAIIPASLNVENSGNWSTLPDGRRIWTLEIYAPKALAILLYYDKFIIPEGGKLFIYNPDHSKVLGAYTHRSNSKKAEFATEFVPGDRIILEYLASLSPSGETDFPEIEISGIAYGYNHLRVSAGDGLVRLRWDSDPCMINVNCPEGTDWQDQKKGVARIVTPVGSMVSLCSGTLVNNTSGDFDPLLLSAYHCFDDMSASTLNQTIYYFNYEYPACVNLGTDPYSPTMTGAQLLLALDIDGESDGALLRLNDSIPESYDVYFNGWDRRNIAPQNGVTIHHPSGDVKKISTFTSPAISLTWETNEETGAPYAHWNVFFSPTVSGYGVTQGGSSGAPLFNENKLVVGTLTGGSSSCQLPEGLNLYGKLWYHWNQGLQRMAEYLDPDNRGLEYLEGIYPDYTLPRAKFRTDRKEIYVSQAVEFINASVNDNTWKWTFEGGNPGISFEKNPPPITFSTPGLHGVSLTVNEGTDTEATFSKAVEVVIKESLCPEEITLGNITDGKTSQFPLGALNRQTLSSSIYTAEETGLTTGGKIKKIAWNAGTANSTASSLFVYLKETDDSMFPASNITWANELEGATLVYEGSDTWTGGWMTVTLPEEFRYSGTKNLKVIVRAIAPDNGEINSQCSCTAASNKHLRATSSSIGMPSGNGTRNSNRPDIRFYVERFCGVELPKADFKIETLSGETSESLIGDTIHLTDLSTGPVVNREWLFPGGIPDRSTEERPSVVYKQTGNHAVTLNVSNHLGSDTGQKTVTINGKAPVAAFSSFSDGFTTYPDYGQFLPFEGGTVTFTDKSLFYPTEWAWDLNGIDDDVRQNESLLAITYPAGENAYPVKLTVRNDMGSNTKELTDYVKIGGTARVWNIPYGDEGKTYHELSEGGYLTGTNAAYAIFAEKFTSMTGGAVSQVDILMNVFNDVRLNSRNYQVSIYNEKNGFPGDNLGSVTFAGSKINRSGYTGVAFEEPVFVQGNFYVEIKGMGTPTSTQVAIAASESSEPTVYVLKNQEWKPLEDYDANLRKVSMNIVPTYTYISATGLANLPGKNGQTVKLYPNPVGSYLNFSSQYPVKKITIRDIQGRRVLEADQVKREGTIHTSSWLKGVYIVNVQIETGSYNYKIIKK